MRIIASGLRFPEGPVWTSDGSVLLVEIERKTLTRVWPDGRVEVVAQMDGGPNGAAVGPDGRIYITNNGGFGWIREGNTLRTGLQPPDYQGGSIDVVDSKTGRIERLYDSCDGRRLVGPNDLVFDTYGGFWFSDLGKRRARDMDLGGVYYAKADGSGIREVVHGMLTANGVGLSPDGKCLYVAETLPGRLWAFEIVGPGEVRKAPWPSLYGGRLVAGLPGETRLDSLAVSASGNICVAGLTACAVVEISPDGNRIRHHAAPDLMVTNICFGGAELRQVYITLSYQGQLAVADWYEPGLRLAYEI
jgi:gluconolactonase